MKTKKPKKPVRWRVTLIVVDDAQEGETPLTEADCVDHHKIGHVLREYPWDIGEAERLK